MSRISLKGMKFHAYHGVYDEERKKGNTFIVDLDFDTDTTIAETTDDITDTLNYEAVYDLVRSEMETPSMLLEHIAKRIMTSVKSQFPEISNITLAVIKCNPPVNGSVNSVSIYLQS